ncbi:hypothetical protein M422DRAFT_171020 [Sphaerobolus stellatus SS14]|uniref:Uncharacterized protein n=1 Tax=Sphaerobolus stellatus (strain SS14) TaxID=990650 RepID=A0A0C9VLH2_SPHS4|nr:hypothetical protein M422DRAFT_171020 [Sphaerobolus stellatus SS14]
MLCLGQLESTILQTFTRGTSLRRWLGRPETHSALRECKELFEKIFKGKSEQEFIHPHQESNKRETRFPFNLQLATQHSHGTLHGWHHGAYKVTYSRASTHLGNSLILFYPRGNRDVDYVPASIKYIFSVGSKVQFAAHRHLEAAGDFVDPFSIYPHFPAKLYSTILKENLEIIEVDWVFSHFARYNFTSDLVVVLPLSRE